MLGEQLWGENLKEAIERNPKTVFVIDDNWAFLISRSVALEGEQARQVAEVWRQLPPGIAAYCHIPAFGLEFITEAYSHTQASICWQCNNIFLVEDGQYTSYDFDGQSDMGQRLLELLKAHATKG